MKINLLIHRFVRRQRTALLVVSSALLCTGCGLPKVTQDSLGNNVSQIQQVYTRAGTDIKIDILKGCYDSGRGPCVPGAPDLTSAQITLITQALDKLSAQQLIQSGINTIEVIPNDPPGITKFNNVIVVSEPASDTNIGNEILIAMGFPPAATAASSTKSPPSPSPNLMPASGGPTTVTPLDAQGSQAISSQSPSTYVPIKSKEGMQAVMSDYSLGQSKDPTKQPTFQDQVRPHGDVNIVTPEK